jgi:Ca2+-binding EF-hand superfamily protein
LTQTVKTASLLAAIAALDVDVIGESMNPSLSTFLIPPLAEVLEESEEKTFLIQELRSRIIQQTTSRGLQQRELLETIFKEIDVDGSGEIDSAEFKSLLVKMDMGYSGKKFTRLYRAIDRDGNGSLSLAELNHLLFPDDAKKREVEEQGLKIQSRLDRRISVLESEQHAESDRVSLSTHRKRLGQISSLKSLSESTWKQTIGTIPTPTDLAPGDPIIREVVVDKYLSTNLGEAEAEAKISQSPLLPPPIIPRGGTPADHTSDHMVDIHRSQSLPPIVVRGTHHLSSTNHEPNSQSTHVRNLSVRGETPVRSNSFDEPHRLSSPKFVSPLLLSTNTSVTKEKSPRGVLHFHDPNDEVSAPPFVRPQGIHINRKIAPSPDGNETFATSQSATPAPESIRRSLAQIVI